MQIVQQLDSTIDVCDTSGMELDPYEYLAAPATPLPTRKLFRDVYLAQGFEKKAVSWWKALKLHRNYHRVLDEDESILPLVYMLAVDPKRYLDVMKRWEGSFSYDSEMGCYSIRGQMISITWLPSLQYLWRGWGKDPHDSDVKAGLFLGMSPEQAKAAATKRVVAEYYAIPFFALCVSHLNAPAEKLRRAREIFDIMVSQKPITKQAVGELDRDFYSPFDPRKAESLRKAVEGVNGDIYNLIAWLTLRIFIYDLTDETVAAAEENKVTPMEMYELWYAGFHPRTVVEMKKNDIDTTLATDIFPSRFGFYDFKTKPEFVEFKSSAEKKREQEKWFDKIMKDGF